MSTHNPLKEIFLPSLIFALVGFSTNFAHSQTTASPQKSEYTCCSKEQLEVTEQDEAERRKADQKNFDQRRKDILASGTDQEMWSIFSIYSDSHRQEDLVSPIERKSGFNMQLDPQSGKLTFSQGKTKDTFRIALPANFKGDVCPIYLLRTLDASSSYAFFSRTCLPYEYEPHHFEQSHTYYLYDIKSKALQTIWSTDAPSFQPNPPLHLKAIANGYQWDWISVVQGTKIVRHVKYIQKMNYKTGKLELVCHDSAPVDHTVEYNETACDATGTGITYAEH